MPRALAATACPVCAADDAAIAPEWLIGGALARRCGRCELLFVDPPPSDDVLTAFYGSEGGWHASHTKVSAEKARAKTKRSAPELFAALDAYFPASHPPAGQRVLDFGCGTGILLNSFQDRGWQTAGIEPSTEIAFARHQQLRTIPVEPTFDLIVLYHVLEHLPRPLDILQQLAGALKVGGHCFISVPRVDAVAEHGDWFYCLNHTHVVGFTETCLRGVLKRAGLTPVAPLHHLDHAMTKGRPLRLRLLARKDQG